MQMLIRIRRQITAVGWTGPAVVGWRHCMFIASDRSLSAKSFQLLLSALKVLFDAKWVMLSTC